MLNVARGENISVENDLLEGLQNLKITNAKENQSPAQRLVTSCSPSPFTDKAPVMSLFADKSHVAKSKPGRQRKTGARTKENVETTGEEREYEPYDFEQSEENVKSKKVSSKTTKKMVKKKVTKSVTGVMSANEDYKPAKTNGENCTPQTKAAPKSYVASVSSDEDYKPAKIVASRLTRTTRLTRNMTKTVESSRDVNQRSRNEDVIPRGECLFRDKREERRHYSTG